jgi:hypothetical protein
MTQGMGDAFQARAFVRFADRAASRLAHSASIPIARNL